MQNDNRLTVWLARTLMERKLAGQRALRNWQRLSSCDGAAARLRPHGGEDAQCHAAGGAALALGPAVTDCIRNLSAASASKAGFRDDRSKAHCKLDALGFIYTLLDQSSERCVIET